MQNKITAMQRLNIYMLKIYTLNIYILNIYILNPALCCLSLMFNNATLLFATGGVTINWRCYD